MADWDVQRSLQIAKRFAQVVSEDDPAIDFIVGSLFVAAAASSYTDIEPAALHAALDQLLGGATQLGL